MNTENTGQQLPGEETVQVDGVQQYASYAEYKSTLDRELTKTAESFVRIGYLLKMARDTPILRDSGYETVVDFAQAEYGIDKSTVSRFININTRFSEGGCSDRLKVQYEGFGYAKLALMLSLPDEINENLTPEYSKAEIQAIKDEVDEERLVTDIERMLEDPGDAAEKTLIERLVDQLGQDDPDLYAEMYKILSDTWSIEDIKETMAPAGQKSYSIRLPRTGRFLLMLDTQSDTARMINARTYEKEECGWGELGKAWTALVDDGMEAKESWSKHYCREYPEVAPVQPGSVQKSAKTVSKPQKAAKVQKAPVEWASAYKPGQTVKIILNGDVGRLVKKGAWPGDWVVEIGQKVKTLSEGTFKKFDENEDQVQQETLHSVEASIPEPDPVPTVNEEPEEHQEQPMEQETQMEGQQSIEDYPEYMPDAEVIPPAAPEGAAVDRFHKVILDHINDLKRHVLADEWKMAQMDLEMIQDALNRGEDMAELEDDE